MSDAPPTLWHDENSPLYNDASITYNDPSVFYNSSTLDAQPTEWFDEEADVPD